MAVCACKNEFPVNYTEEAIRDVVLSGIRSPDIRREALSTEGLQDKPINGIIAFVEGREMASKAVAPTPSYSSLSAATVNERIREKGNPPALEPLDHYSSLATTSTFKRERLEKDRVSGKVEGRAGSPNTLLSRTAKCPGCGDLYHLYRRTKRGVNRRPYSNCQKCWRNSRDLSDTNQVNSSASSSAICVSQISKVRASRAVGHKVFRDGKWRAAKFRAHPTLSLNISLEGSSKTAYVIAITDTGAQSNLWCYKDYISAGFSEADLNPVVSQFRVADNRAIPIVGVFRGIIEGKSSNGRLIRCRSMIYVSSSISGFFLSYDTLLDLGVIDPSFPQVDSFRVPGVPRESVVSSGTRISADVLHIDHHQIAPCKCPQRSAVPSRPSDLPFEPVPANIPKMRDWLLEHFASSTFNTCPHRPLQQMAGPPIQIHLKDDAKPKVRDTAAVIPLHWQTKVRSDIVRDEALGIIEKVPYGIPTTWCHRMVVTRKSDGTPRRTVDL